MAKARDKATDFSQASHSLYCTACGSHCDIGADRVACQSFHHPVERKQAGRIRTTADS